MPVRPQPLLMDHRVDLYIPSQCICANPLPESLRESVLRDVKEKLDGWFGGHTEFDVKGDWRLPDGTLAKEPVTNLYSYCTNETFELHAGDVDALAVEIANRLSQDRVLRVFDNLKIALWPNTLLDLRRGQNCACRGRVSQAGLALPQPQDIGKTDHRSKMLVIHGILRSFSSVEHARKLFCNCLNYSYTSGSLPWAGWPESIRQTLDCAPEILAEQNEFKILHLRLDSSRLRRGPERSVIRRIYQDDPSFCGLFLVSNKELTEWEFVNARNSQDDAAKILFRRLRVGSDAPLRTATERISLVEISETEEKTITAADIQKRHNDAFDVEAVTKEFYREIADWYFWALQHPKVVYPRSVKGEDQQSIFLIRLLTRLIFCRFLQEKGLIPREFFECRYIKQMLKDFSPRSGTFYKAFLQNLFFASLNQEQDKRGFRKKYEGSRDGNRGSTTLYRYADLLEDASEFLEKLRLVPFVNGGLFDCLDEVFIQSENKKNVRLDDFSEERENHLCVPNELFFGTLTDVDLSEAYGDTKHKHEVVRGLLEVLGRYKFTVEENTPFDQEIALDPEMLGKVFENLLASYNEDTRTTARKATGSFYTPREIVSYMVDESLAAYLAGALSSDGPEKPENEKRIRGLFAAEDSSHDLTDQEVEALIDAMDRIKILDPACGSGAFPMGALHRLVDVLQKVDPNNRHWKKQQLTKARHDLKLAEQMEDDKNREAAISEAEARIADIEHSFDTRFHELDFARKLYLIENCIHGVDIQPIACQIAKLRFFIALIVDQIVDESAPNRGVRPLPNLETKVVAANSLIPIERPQQLVLMSDQIPVLRRQLEQVRHDYFVARTPAKKAKCREKDARLRNEISILLRDSGMRASTAKELAAWDPYDQNAHASFFDPEWMFGISGSKDGGFDIVIGNPPYIRIQTLKQQDPAQAEFFKEHYASASKGNYDIYVVFIERGMQLLRPSGILAYICSHKFFNAKYGEPLRALIAKGKHLKHVVHFGDQQVFPGASNYVCLLFLAKPGAGSCRWMVVDDLLTWLASTRALQATVAAEQIGIAEWSFSVGRCAALLDRLQRIPTKLEHVTARIFQGIKTSADRVFIVQQLERTKKQILVHSPEQDEEYTLEPDLLHPLIKGGDSRRYELTLTNRLILFPYLRDSNGQMRLIGEAVLKRDYPNTMAYLRDNRKTLEDRERGNLNAPSWYAYGRSQALDVISSPKIFTPDIAPSARFSLDSTGNVFFTGGAAGGYGILPADPYRHEFLLGVLNSLLIDYIHHKIATQMRGGWYSYEARFIRQLPIRAINFGVKTERAEHDALVSLVDRILNAKNLNPQSDTTALEQEINERVYRLYGLTKDEIKFVEEEG